MKKILGLIIIVLITTSCNRRTEKHYKNSSETSGGFMDIQFHLNADKTLNLIRIDQKEVSQNEIGTTFVPETLFIAGTWEIWGDKFRCEIKESEQFIMEAFFKSSFETKDCMQHYNQIIFPLSTDTIFIYGQPCIATQTTSR